MVIVLLVVLLTGLNRANMMRRNTQSIRDCSGIAPRSVTSGGPKPGCSKITTRRIRVMALTICTGQAIAPIN